MLLFFFLKTPPGEPTDPKEIERFKKEFSEAFDNEPPAPLIILPPGCDIDLLGRADDDSDDGPPEFCPECEPDDAFSMN